jgi:hypothetical protein
MMPYLPPVRYHLPFLCFLFRVGKYFSYKDYISRMSDKQSIFLENGDRYEGDLSGKQKHGYGVYNYVSGDTYTGDWVNDQQSGHGIYTFANGSRY